MIFFSKSRDSPDPFRLVLRPVRDDEYEYGKTLTLTVSPTPGRVDLFRNILPHSIFPYTLHFNA